MVSQETILPFLEDFSCADPVRNTPGDPKGYSAMSRLVGTPCAVACLKVLDGTISEKGILAP